MDSVLTERRSAAPTRESVRRELRDLDAAFDVLRPGHDLLWPQMLRVAAQLDDAEHYLTLREPGATQAAAHLLGEVRREIAPL